MSAHSAARSVTYSKAANMPITKGVFGHPIVRGHLGYTGYEIKVVLSVRFNFEDDAHILLYEETTRMNECTLESGGRCTQDRATFTSRELFNILVPEPTIIVSSRIFRNEKYALWFRTGSGFLHVFRSGTDCNESEPLVFPQGGIHKILSLLNRGRDFRDEYTRCMDCNNRTQATEVCAACAHALLGTGLSMAEPFIEMDNVLKSDMGMKE